MPSKEEGRGEKKKGSKQALFEPRDFFWEQLKETLFGGGTEATVYTLLQIIDICNSIATLCCQGIE